MRPTDSSSNSARLLARVARVYGMRRRGRVGAAALLGWILVVSAGSCRPSEASSAPAAAPVVERARLLETANFLASDDLAGRYSLDREHIGQAARFLAEHFERAGLQPVGTSYFHDVPISVGSPGLQNLDKPPPPPVEPAHVAPNVIGYWKGTKAPHEIVVVGGHYDHIGTQELGHHCRRRDPGDPDTICNGADDNASGAAAVVEIARAMAVANYRPQRTLVFVEFVGEEMGLYGSRTLAFTPPQAEPFAKGRVVAMINLDMIGRLSSEGLFVGGLSSSSAWMPLLETIDYRGMPVLFDLSISARSDHASFYHQKVPVLFFFTGLHDDYHRASDNPDKLFEPGYVAVTQIVLEVVQKLADGHPLPFTEPKTEEEGLVMAIPGDNPKTIVRRLQGR